MSLSTLSSRTAAACAAARHHVRGLGHRRDHVVGEVLGVRAGEPHPLEALDLAAGAEQLAEGEAVAELDAVGVHVLPQQGHLGDALGDQRLDLGEDLAGPAVLLLAAERGDDAERAGVVAATEIDTHAAYADSRLVGSVEGNTSSDSRISTWASSAPWPARAAPAASRCCACRTPRPPRARGGDLAAVLLREAAAHGDLHAGVSRLDRSQVAEVAVELVVGVLPHRARVEDDHVGVVRVTLAGPSYATRPATRAGR